MSTNAPQPSPDSSNTPQQSSSGTSAQGSSVTSGQQGETTQFIVTVVEPAGQTLGDAARQRIRMALQEAVDKELASETQQGQGPGASDAPPPNVKATLTTGITIG